MIRTSYLVLFIVLLMIRAPKKWKNTTKITKKNEEPTQLEKYIDESLAKGLY